MKSKFTYFLILLFSTLVGSTLMAQTVTHVVTSDSSFTVPTGVTQITVQVWGGGGAGGAATYFSNPEAAGSGGGGGGYVTAVLTGLSGQTFSLDVGAAASGGGANGSNGWESSITVGATKFITAFGGIGGLHNNADGAPAGGLGGSGSVTSPGGFTIFSNSVLIGQQGGSGSSGIFLTSGAGGNAAYLPGGGGTGAAGVSGGTTTNGLTGNPYGGGGSGGLAVASGTGNGGGGSSGRIVITYICPALTVNYPGNETISACFTQGQVDTQFDDWFDDFSVSGGANLSYSINPSSPSAPDRCGGSVTVVMSYTSVCYSDVITRTFTVTEDTPLTWAVEPPDDIVLNAPSNDCELQVTWPTVSVNDDCPLSVTRVLTSSVPLTENVPNTHGDFPVGISTVTYTYTDGCGHIISKTFTVTILDVTAPTLTGCPSPIIVNATPGLCTAVVTWTPPSSSDNCSGDVMVASHNSGQTFPVGLSTVTYVATDASGNQSTCTFTVTVIDNQPPLVTCPTTPQTANNDPGQCYTSLTFAATVSDNCAVASTTYSIGASTITFPYNFPVGTTTVNVLVEDIHTLTATCTFDVVVTDNELPVVNTQNIASLPLSASGVAYIVPADINNGSTDNCGIATYTLDVSSFDCDDLGLNTVTLTVTDIHGNPNTGTATVFVVDLIDPVIACIGAVSYSAVTGTCTYTYTGIDNHWGISSATDNCDVVTYNYTVAGATTIGSGSSIIGQSFNVGVTTVTWTVYDQSGNDASCSFTVTINDVDNPVLSMPTVAASYNADSGVCYASLNLAATASDNCGIDHIKYYLTGPTEITLPYNFPVGSTVVTVIATDVNGLTDTDTYTVVVVDNQPPTVTCPAAIVVYADPGACNKGVIFEIPFVDDNCGIQTYTLTTSASPAIALSVYINPLAISGWYIEASGTFPIGTTSVTATVTDDNGLTASCTFTVTVHHNDLPNAVATTTTLQLDASGNATLNAAAFSAGSTPGIGHCAYGSIVVSPTAFTCANVGANVVTVTVTDKTGRVDVATATVTVEDNVFPVVTPQNADVYLDASGNGSIVYGDVIASYTDACGTLTPTISPSTFTCSDVALSPITINISVFDVNGNETTETAQVTVHDEIDPIVVTQNITVQLDGAGTVTITAAQIDNGSSDACGTATMTVSPSSFTCDNLGPNIVTLTVYDVNGNFATATATVTVEDDEDPVITCNGTTTTVFTTTACTYVHSGTGWDANATDNCDVSVAYALTGATTGTGTSLAGVAFNVGVTTVTWTATDEDGNTDVCSFTITVEDIENPVFTLCPSNQSILTEGPNMTDCDAVAQWTIPVATDNCPSVTYSWYTSNPSIPIIVNATTHSATFPVGETTVYYIATDAAGNKATCTFTITVDDRQDPVAITQNIPVNLDASGNASITVDQIDNGSTDNCGIATMTLDVTEFTCADLGPNTVILTVVDHNGRTDTQSAIVTVFDITNPVVIAQDVTVELDAFGNATLDPALVNDGSSDACGIITYTLSQSSFDCSDIGTVVVTLYGEDASGNIGSATATVTVEDNIDPVLTCTGNKVVDTDSDVCTYTHSGTAWNATVTDNCTVTSPTYTLSGVTSGSGTSLDGVEFLLGVTTIDWTYTDAGGNTVTCSFTVTVEDNQVPVISCTSNQIVQTDLNACSYTQAGTSWDATVTDNCTVTSPTYTLSGVTSGSGTTLNNVVFNRGVTTVLWSYTDGGANTVTCSFTVTVEDKQAPSFSCPANIVVTTTSGNCQRLATWYRPVATDNCPGTFIYAVSSDNPDVEILNTFDINLVPQHSAVFPVGVTQVTHTITDANGNVASCTFTVTVHSFTPPSAIAKNITVALDAVTGEVTIAATDVNNGSSIGCMASPEVIGDFLTLSQYTFDCGDVGANVVTLTVTDKSGRTATATAVVTVEDNTDPVITPENIIVYLDATGNASIDYTDVVFSVVDNCATETPTLSVDAFDCDDAGSTVSVTITVLDEHGNTGTAVALVTVVDNTPPTAVAQNVTVYLDANGTATTTAAAVNFNSTDNCGVATMTLDVSSFTCANIGPNVVTLTVYDPSGNPSTATATVTVVDDIDPVISCLASSPTVSTNSACTYVHSGTGWDATATDNCTIASPTYTLSGVTSGTGTTLNNVTFNFGVTTVLWSVTDAGGNTVTCSYTVTVEDNEDPVFVNFPANQVRNTLNVNSCTRMIQWTQPQVTDNCGVLSVTVATSNPDINPITWVADAIVLEEFPVGITTVTYTATDVNGNVYSQSFTVKVIDLVDPVVNTKPATVYLDASGNASITTTDVNNGSTDNCGIDYMVVSPNAFTCANLGTNIVTLTVYDLGGRSASATAIVTVVDAIAPTVTCTLSATRDTDNDLCTYTAVAAEFDLLGYADNCGVVTVTNSFNNAASLAGAIFPKGTTTVVWTVYDASGNPATCTLDVTVEDNQDPDIACVGAQIKATDAGECFYTVVGAEFDPTSVDDNCTVTPTITNDFNSQSTLAGAEFPKGTTTVVWTAEDADGNTATCSFTVTVNDEEDPTIACVTDTFRYNDLGDCDYTAVGAEFDPSFDDNCPGATISNSINSLATLAGVDFPVGMTTVVWTVLDAAGNTASCTMVINVEDNEDPVFTTFPVFTDPFIVASSGNCDLYLGWDIPTTADNCGIASMSYTWSTTNTTTTNLYFDGSIPGRLFATFPQGTTTITYVVYDIHGNSATDSFSITVKDLDKPFALTQNVTVYLDAVGTATITAADVDNGSYDVCGNVTMTVSPSTFGCSDVTTPVVVTLTVTDLSGNISTATATVTVIDNIDPTIACVGNQTRDTDLGECSYLVDGTEFDPTAVADNCPSYIVSNSFNGASTLAGATLPKGITTIVWTVTDASGNIATCSFDVTVEDNEAPEMACVVDQVKVTDPGVCNYTVVGAEFDPTAVSDNCTVTVTLTNDYNNSASLAGAVFNKGVTTVVWTATDDDNNVKTCTYTVTVNDEEDPTIACVTDTFRYNDAGVCGYTATAAEFDPSFDDNCPDSFIEHDYLLGVATNTLTGSFFPVGTTPVTWTVTDASGNTATCTIIVVVEDNEDPSFSSFPNAVTLTTTSQNVCTQQHLWNNPIPVDNCGILAGSLTRSWTSTHPSATINFQDLSGNQTQALFPVGVTTIFYSVSDIHGNVYTQTFTVTIDDGFDPVISKLPVDRVIEGCTVADITGPVFADVMTLSSESVFEDAVNQGDVSDNCQIAEVWYVDVIVNAACPIEVDRTWYIIDHNSRTVSYTQSITVDETTPPHLVGTLPGGDVGNVCMANMPAAPDAADIAVLYEDNCSGTNVSATFTSTVSSGTDCGWTITHTFTVTDVCMNETLAHVVYTGADDEAPGLVSSALTCSSLDVADQNLCLEVAEAFDPTTLEAAVAALYADNCNNVTATYVGTVSGTTNTDCSWSFTYEFSVSDDCGNAVSCFVTYSGGDDEVPVLAGTLPGENVGSVCMSARPAAPSTALIAALYTDNCGVVTSTLINTELSGTDCGWTVTYTYSVEDECDNFAANAVVVYTGADVTKPVVSNNPLFELNYTCGTLVPAQSEAHVLWDDNCSSVVTMTFGPSYETQMGCNQTYTITRTFTVTDQCGNSTVHLQIINVRDDVPPSLTGTPYAGLSNVDACLANAVATAPFVPANAIIGYTDNCSATVTATLTDTEVVGTDCRWTITYTFTVADECGNPLPGQTYVNTGGDLTPPALTGTPYAGPTDVNACAANAETAAPFSSANAIMGYTDNCGGLVFAQLEDSEVTGTDCNWTLTYFYTIHDECGNVNENQTYSVSGSDQTDPELTGTPYAGLTNVNACYDNAEIAAPFNAAEAIAGYTDNCGAPVSATLTATDKSGTDCEWTVTYTFTITDECGNDLTGQTYTNTGGDSEEPELSTVPANQIVSVTTGECYYEVPSTSWDVTATDNCATVTPVYTLSGATTGSGETLEGVQFETGLTTVVWSVSDDCGHTVSDSFTVQVNETEPPSWTAACVTDQDVNVDTPELCTYTHVGTSWDATATDNCGSVTVEYELTGATTGTGTTLDGQTFNCGVTTVTWTATDASNNVISCTFTVTVKPTELRGNVSYYRYNAANTPLDGVVVNLLDGSNNVLDTYTTDASGDYEFTDQTLLEQAVAIEVSTTRPHNGMSAIGSLAIQRAALGLPVVYWTPTNFLNHVGNVYRGFAPANPVVGPPLNIIDAAFAQQRNMNPAFAFDAGDWAFHSPADEVLFTNTALSTARRVYAFNFCTLDIEARTFGDVRGIYQVAPLKSSKMIQTDDVIEVGIGEVFELPLVLETSIEFSAMDIDLWYDNSRVEVLEVKSDIPELSFEIKDGVVHASWTSVQPISRSAGDAVITMVVRTIGAVNPTDVLFRQGNLTEFGDLTAMPVKEFGLSISSLSNVNNDPTLNDDYNLALSAWPNPFRDELRISYTIAHTSNVRLTLVNAIGAEIEELVDMEHVEGTHELKYTLTGSSLHPGIYFIRMEVSGERGNDAKAIKLVRMR